MDCLSHRRRVDTTSFWSATLRLLTYLVVVQLAFISGQAAAQRSCTRTTIATLMSPYNSWAVTIEEEACSQLIYATTTIDNIVRVARLGAIATLESDVLVVNVGGSWKARPLLEWIAPAKLQITLLNRSFIGLRKPKYEDVEIVLKFDLDDPADRAQFLKELGLPPD